MSNIIDLLTPVYYKLQRFSCKLEDGELTLYSDVGIYNQFGGRIGNDHPTPQATQAELTAFQAWIERNLASYESVTGLTELEE